MNDFDKEQVLWLSDHLKGLGEGTKQPRLIDQGICNDLYWQIRGHKISAPLDAAALDLMVDWPEYSGDESFPVPHPTLEPEKAYSTVCDLWNDSSDADDNKYRHARKRLCLWLSDRVLSLIKPTEED